MKHLTLKDSDGKEEKSDFDVNASKEEVSKIWAGAWSGTGAEWDKKWEDTEKSWNWHRPDREAYW